MVRPLLMLNALWVGAGGFFGALLRWGVSSAVERWTVSGFPWATLLVNVAGCFAIGWLHGLDGERVGWLTPQSRAFLNVGLLGGFTTFSAFAWDSFDRGRELGAWIGPANIAANVLLGLAAVAAGYALSRG